MVEGQILYLREKGEYEQLISSDNLCRTNKSKYKTWLTSVFGEGLVLLIVYCFRSRYGGNDRLT